MDIHRVESALSNRSIQPFQRFNDLETSTSSPRTLCQLAIGTTTTKMKLATQRLTALAARTQPTLQRQIATSSALLNAPKPKLSDAPIPTPRPIFPPANNPFAAPPAPPTTSSPTTAAAVSVPADNAGGKHSPLKIAVVKALAKMMGYNTKSVTAIRETGNMVGSIVRAVERDHDFWYSGTHCSGRSTTCLTPVQNAPCHQHTNHSSKCTYSTYSSSSRASAPSRPQPPSRPPRPSPRPTKPRSSPTSSNSPRTRCG
jgi:hypothetical protein